MKKLFFSFLFVLLAFSIQARAQVAVYGLGQASADNDNSLMFGYSAIESTYDVALYYDVYEEAFMLEGNFPLTGTGSLGYNFAEVGSVVMRCTRPTTFSTLTTSCATSTLIRVAGSTIGVSATTAVITLRRFHGKAESQSVSA